MVEELLPANAMTGAATANMGGLGPRGKIPCFPSLLALALVYAHLATIAGDKGIYSKSI